MGATVQKCSTVCSPTKEPAWKTPFQEAMRSNEKDSLQHRESTKQQNPGALCRPESEFTTEEVEAMQADTQHSTEFINELKHFLKKEGFKTPQSAFEATTIAGSSRVSTQDFKIKLRGLGFTGDLENMASSLDLDQDGFVSIEEFMCAVKGISNNEPLRAGGPMSESQRCRPSTVRSRSASVSSESRPSQRVNSLHSWWRQKET
eukprot:gnl/MRDRNA2_/MRDRNA2_106372_c0_seq1.p1 gnl/MRDRNA2_/MRDRNA2_106372_c0~~gnl/MRDRNA2_/MRDRNA2_106372_c0_seq1.p1  ORF type:complete len:204 (-),score=41.63 gnl/MRDRNA2_/MRDRNA2_106372_c0_seq1:184-795(-)